MPVKNFCALQHSCRKASERRKTVTAPQMLEAARLLNAPKFVPVHDEHKSLRPMLKVTSSIRDLDTVNHDDVEIIELDFGRRYEGR